MDIENAALQERLHEANQDRMRSIEDEQRRMRETQTQQTTTLATIAANTACIPVLVERVDNLEKTDNRHKGALTIIGILWTALAGYVGLMH